MQLNGGILDQLTGKTTSDAVDTALNTAAARPFQVTIAVEPSTRNWLSVAVGVLTIAVLWKQLGR